MNDTLLYCLLVARNEGHSHYLGTVIDTGLKSNDVVDVCNYLLMAVELV